MEQQFQSRNRESYLFKCPERKPIRGCDERFNLVIENLIFSSKSPQRDEPQAYSFNLVIENLIFSS